jgi:ADP-ribosylglycohydrolase
MSSLPEDYLERVYAGVLGKMIGVYLGRPIEGWTYARIGAELGDITCYVHERLGRPLIVTDDDLTGTFTFLRSLQDYGYSQGITPAQVGQTWLNYIIEGRTILWWGGMGNSTEHTAYLRLKAGIPAPLSGSAGLNGKVVSEQIGAQIFIDGWGMVAPGEPGLAADLAQRAASVSHDGEAIYAAQVVAAMEAQAFVESDIGRLLDTGLKQIPTHSVIYRLICELRTLRQSEADWRSARAWLDERYGYHIFPGNCHVVPNHGLIILALLYGDGDFQRSMMIVNTCGWDTDCNAGNLGCLLGIRGGLAGLEGGPDWRGPLADRLYLPTADGGRAISDAAHEALQIANMGRALQGLQPLSPKQGARLHFEMPGSLQGFTCEANDGARLGLANVPGYSRLGGRSLALNYEHSREESASRAYVATFTPPEAMDMQGYELLASPAVYSGQVARLGVGTDPQNREGVGCRIVLWVYGARDHLDLVRGPQVELEAGAYRELAWRLPDTGGAPIARLGLELYTQQPAQGIVYLDYLTWEGEPQVVFRRPESGGEMWRRAWVDAVEHSDCHPPATYRLIQNRGTGLLIQGTRQWRNYRVSAQVKSYLAQAIGIAARVQGLERYYALTVGSDHRVRLVKFLDGASLLAEANYPWEVDRPYDLSLVVWENRLRAYVDGNLFFDLCDESHPLECGAVALVCREGFMLSSPVSVGSEDHGHEGGSAWLRGGIVTQ